MAIPPWHHRLFISASQCNHDIAAFVMSANIVLLAGKKAVEVLYIHLTLFQIY